MKDKYLPIGSIVDIHDTNKSVMIVGYYAIKYQNVVKMYDYMGVSYPEGTLLDGTFAFNHEDINTAGSLVLPAVLCCLFILGACCYSIDRIFALKK